MCALTYTSTDASTYPKGPLHRFTELLAIGMNIGCFEFEGRRSGRASSLRILFQIVNIMIDNTCEELGTCINAAMLFGKPMSRYLDLSQFPAEIYPPLENAGKMKIHQKCRSNRSTRNRNKFAQSTKSPGHSMCNQWKCPTLGERLFKYRTIQSCLFDIFYFN